MSNKILTYVYTYNDIPVDVREILYFISNFMITKGVSNFFFNFDYWTNCVPSNSNYVPNFKFLDLIA